MLPKMNKQVADVVEIPDSDEEDDGPTGSGRTNAPPGGAPLSPVLSRETLGTRSFWKAGNFAVAPTAKFDLAGDSLEHARVHPKFLHSNATSHKWAFGAIAELLDNAVDEIHHGATFVKVDKVDIMKDKSPALLFQDDGGGMDPEAIRKCMSLGYSSKKSNTTIGQYGNGFKTSTMRLGADVIVFSRATHASKATQSVGLLSYTFLRRTGQDDVIVPMIDFDISKGWVDPITYGSQDDWLSDLKTILEWSPFSSKEELMEQFEDIGSHGTKVIIYNLWLNDEGVYELSFDDDEEDIRLRDEANSGETRLSKKALEVQSHISYRIHFSLRAYASVLYLRKFENFQIIIRGKPVMQFHIADELKYTAVVKYKPQLASGSKELTVDTTIGFIKEAPALPVCGFNVYHKNRLIRPFWKVTAEGHSRGNGVVGVLEANFIEPAHNKQDFERSTLFIRLEARLKQMVMDYWRQHCHLVGYKPDRSMQHVLQKGTGQPHVVDPEDIQMQSVVSLPESMLQDTVTGQTGLDDGLYHGVTSDAQDSTFVDQICEENIKLFMRCEEYVREEEDLKQTVEKLERELHEAKRRCALLNSILDARKKKKVLRQPS